MTQRLRASTIPSPRGVPTQQQPFRIMEIGMTKQEGRYEVAAPPFHAMKASKAKPSQATVHAHLTFMNVSLQFTSSYHMQVPHLCVASKSNWHSGETSSANFRLSSPGGGGCGVVSNELEPQPHIFLAAFSSPTCSWYIACGGLAIETSSPPSALVATSAPGPDNADSNKGAQPFSNAPCLYISSRKHADMRMSVLSSQRHNSACWNTLGSWVRIWSDFVTKATSVNKRPRWPHRDLDSIMMYWLKRGCSSVQRRRIRLLLDRLRTKQLVLRSAESTNDENKSKVQAVG